MNPGISEVLLALRPALASAHIADLWFAQRILADELAMRSLPAVRAARDAEFSLLALARVAGRDARLPVE